MSNFSTEEPKNEEELFVEAREEGDIEEISSSGVKEAEEDLKKDMEKSQLAKEEGNRYFREKDYDGAITMYSRAIALCPEDVEEDGDVEEVVVSEKEKSGPESSGGGADSSNKSASTSSTSSLVISKNKETMSVYLGNRAAAHFAVEEYELAIDDCSSALELNPVYSKVLLRRSQACEKAGRFEEALADA